MFELKEEEPIRYVHYFSNEITVETVQELINTLVGTPSVDLFFTTTGGDLCAMKALLHFINNHPDITIYLTGFIASAGTFFLVDCTQKVILAEDLDCILFHVGDRPSEGALRKQTYDMNILYDQLKEYNTVYAEKFKKLGLTAKEIKAYQAGEDVLLYKKDFNRLKAIRQ